MANTCFPSGYLELPWWTSQEKPWTLDVGASLVDSIWPVSSQLVAGGVSTSWAVLVSSGLLLVPFPPIDFTLSFHCNKLTEYWSLSESWSLKESLRNPSTACPVCFVQKHAQPEFQIETKESWDLVDLALLTSYAVTLGVSHFWPQFLWMWK